MILAIPQTVNGPSAIVSTFVYSKGPYSKLTVRTISMESEPSSFPMPGSRMRKGLWRSISWASAMGWHLIYGRRRRLLIRLYILVRYCPLSRHPFRNMWSGFECRRWTWASRRKTMNEIIIWKAESNGFFHSKTDTGEPVFLPFRMSCFVISNLVVTAGMLTPGLQVHSPPPKNLPHLPFLL